MKNLIFISFLLFSNELMAHSGLGSEHSALKKWHIISENKTIEASFSMMKEGKVYLEDANGNLSHWALTDLSLEDRLYAIQKFQHIEGLNTQPITQDNLPILLVVLNASIVLLSALFAFKIFQIFRTKNKSQWAYSFLFLGLTLVLVSFKNKVVLGTDPNFIDAAFAPYKPRVKTHWDTKYFYVEDLGLPTHQMMVGITSWQQQFPLPQCYTGSNAWSIPINPVVAATPTPTATNFFTGAIGLAANGIPIFNAFNNRGVDSYVIGELDKFGGHCGRADDYHYHIAPLSLDSVRSKVLPIAFALDGFAVYGSKEPDGVDMKTLDANHGHYGTDNVYHYHGNLTYPYMVGNMVGVVTKDASDQIIPQAQTKPIRTAGNPLNGAVITDFKANGTNGYNLTYSLSNQNYNVNYSWSGNTVTFNFVNPTGTTSQAYNNFQNCSLTTPTIEFPGISSYIEVFPNPTKQGFSLDIKSPSNVQAVHKVSVFDMQGREIFSSNNFTSFIDISGWQKGAYIIKVGFETYVITKKLIVD